MRPNQQPDELGIRRSGLPRQRIESDQQPLALTDAGQLRRHRKILWAFGWRPALFQSEVADAPTLEPMMLNDAPQPAQAAIRTDLGAIFVSIELSRRTWLITSLSPGAGEKMS